MKRHLRTAVALAAAALFVSGCKQDSVAFTRKAPAVGQKLKHEQRMEMSFSMNVERAGQDAGVERISTSSSSVVSKTTEVLAANEKAATKLRVTYAEKRDLDKKGEEERKRVSPIVGKTYLVEATPGGVVVTDANGQPVPSEEAREVQLDNKGLGQVDTLSAALPERALKVGEEVPELSRAIEVALARSAPIPGQHQTGGGGTRVTLRETRRDEALFDIAANFAQTNGAMVIKMDIKGTLGFRKSDGQPTELSLKGPVVIEVPQAAGADAAAKADTRGEMAMTITSQPL